MIDYRPFLKVFLCPLMTVTNEICCTPGKRDDLAKRINITDERVEANHRVRVHTGTGKIFT